MKYKNIFLLQFTLMVIGAQALGSGYHVPKRVSLKSKNLKYNGLVVHSFPCGTNFRTRMSEDSILKNGVEHNIIDRKLLINAIKLIDNDIYLLSENHFQNKNTLLVISLYYEKNKIADIFSENTCSPSKNTGLIRLYKINGIYEEINITLNHNFEKKFSDLLKK